MTQHVSIPRDVFQPTGRALPYIPEQPREHSTETAGCTAFPGLCTQVGPHTAHSNHDFIAKRTDWPVSVGFETAFEGTPLLYADTGHAADFEAHEAATVVAQLRAAADAVEAMAAKLTAIKAGAKA
ncbi:hypothetical protein ABZ299_12370 [Streptomyces sp. NPDC006184]|uniref:hypothetical protein n=1 Tax=Streptomyces sp. NPDC006184 TaxID=3155455 RepID=UPI0033B371C5